MQKTFFYQYRIALFFFVVSAIYGWTMRLYKVTDVLSIPYRNILQAHSHVTFLGWGFLAVISLVGIVFYPKIQQTSKYLKTIFGIMTATLLGLLISFPWQGYKLFSIIFLSSFLIASYFYLARILKILKINTTMSSRFIKAGIWYYYLSSIGIWAIAYIVSNYGKIDLYYNAIYFYLHFLYNGFFTFVLFGLMIKFIENRTNTISKYILWFYWLTSISCIPAYTLSLLWKESSSYVVFTAFVAAFIQVISLLFFVKIARFFIVLLKTKLETWLTYFIFIAYFIKITIQFLSAFPIVVKEAMLYKSYFIIGYIHLYTLGFMSLFILLLTINFTPIKINKNGLILLVMGIILSEFLLFSQGLLLSIVEVGIENFDFWLLSVSSLLPLGILVLLIKLKKEGNVFQK